MITEKWEPPNWQQVWENIVEMRKERSAPVDSMGCDRISDEKAPPQVKYMNTATCKIMSFGL